MASASPGKVLRETIKGVTIQVPGAPNALAGLLIEETGFDAIYLSGAAMSVGVLGMPDVGLFTLTELAQQTSYLTARVSIPLIVDADTGFGEPVNVERTVFELEAAGAAAIQLEDQRMPKRCGHLSGKELVDADVMCAKIQAATDARSDPDLVIVARTDARGVVSLEEAIDRARRYLDAGADWIFPEALTTREEFDAFADAVDAPLIANMTEFGKSPLLGLDKLAELGYSVVIYPVTLLRVAMKAMETTLAVLGSDGTQREILDLMQTREELYDMVGYDEYEDRDQSRSDGGS